MIDDICAFIKNIASNPLGTVTDLTVRDYMSIRLHVSYCEECQKAIDDVLDEYGDSEIFPTGSIN